MTIMQAEFPELYAIVCKTFDGLSMCEQPRSTAIFPTTHIYPILIEIVDPNIRDQVRKYCDAIRSTTVSYLPNQVQTMKFDYSAVGGIKYYGIWCSGYNLSSDETVFHMTVSYDLWMRE